MAYCFALLLQIILTGIAGAELHELHTVLADARVALLSCVMWL